MGAHSTSGGFHQKIPSHASKLSPQATTVPSKLPVFNANPQKTVICSHSCPRPLAEARARMMCSRARTRASVRERPAGTTDGRPAGRPARRGRKRHQSEMRYVGGFDVCEAHLNSSKIPDPPLPWHPICGPSLTLYSSSLCCGGLPGDLVFNVVSEEP